MRVVRGGGDPGGQEAGAISSLPEPAAELVLGDELAQRLAEDLIAAVAATYPERITRARSDGEWEFHLGDVIEGARADFRVAISAPGGERDELFDAALRQLLQSTENRLFATDAVPEADGAAPGSGGPS